MNAHQTEKQQELFAFLAEARHMQASNQGWPSSAKSRSSYSLLCASDWAKMSYLETRQLSCNLGLTKAVILLQHSVQQDHLLSHCSCESSLDAQPKQAS